MSDSSIEFQPGDLVQEGHVPIVWEVLPAHEHQGCQSDYCKHHYHVRFWGTALIDTLVTYLAGIRSVGIHGDNVGIDRTVDNKISHHFNARSPNALLVMSLAAKNSREEWEEFRRQAYMKSRAKFPDVYGSTVTLNY